MFEWITGIIIILLCVYCLYQVINVNKKLRRLRRRYDYLLRGRGELNLEELVVRFGRDLDQEIARGKDVHLAARDLEERVKLIESRYDKAVSSLLDSVEETFYKRLEHTEQRLTEEWNRSIAETNHRMNALEQKNQRLWKEETEKNEKNFQFLQKDVNERFSEVAVQLEQHRKKNQSDIEALRTQLTERWNKDSMRLREHISLTLQRVCLYRYNAFEDLGGEQSYTLALLDENGNGVLITSIYSRRGCSTFAKEVRGGKAVQSISPEEEIALKRAMKRGKPEEV